MKGHAYFKGFNCLHVHPTRDEAYVATTNANAAEMRKESSRITATNLDAFFVYHVI